MRIQTSAAMEAAWQIKLQLELGQRLCVERRGDDKIRAGAVFGCGCAGERSFFIHDAWTDATQHYLKAEDCAWQLLRLAVGYAVVVEPSPPPTACPI